MDLYSLKLQVQLPFILVTSANAELVISKMLEVKSNEKASLTTIELAWV